jgi:uncharacterized protein YerC
MKGSGLATNRQREAIRKLSVAQVPQNNIIAETGLSRATIWKVQKTLGLPQRRRPVPLPKKIEKKIVKLLKKGWGRRHIAQHLGIGEGKIKRVMQKTRHRKPRGSANTRYNLTAPERRAIRKALYENESRIAKRFHVSRTWLSAFRMRKFLGRSK